MSSRIHLAVFTLADGNQASELEDSVFELVEEHTPTPMINRRPVEKNPNALDKFEGQQTEYDSRVKTKDPIKQVQNHNSGFPQMKDELDKRRSTSRLTPTNRKTDKTPKTPQNSNSRELKNPRRKNQRTKKRCMKPRIAKTKYRKVKAKLRTALRNARQRAYVCESCGSHYVEKELRMNTSNPTLSICSVDKCKSYHSRNTMSNMSQRYPDSREPSMSSYHTFYSSDHGPMT